MDLSLELVLHSRACTVRHGSVHRCPPPHVLHITHVLLPVRGERKLTRRRKVGHSLSTKDSLLNALIWSTPHFHLVFLHTRDNCLGASDTSRGPAFGNCSVRILTNLSERLLPQHLPARRKPPFPGWGFCSGLLCMGGKAYHCFWSLWGPPNGRNSDCH